MITNIADNITSGPLLFNHNILGHILNKCNKCDTAVCTANIFLEIDCVSSVLDQGFRVDEIYCHFISGLPK